MARIIVLCGILAIVVFSIQFTLCLKAKKKVIKRIPVFIIIAIYAIALILSFMDGLAKSGGVAIWSIFAFILSIANTVALVSDAVAWIVYRQIQKKNGSDSLLN